MIILEVMFLQGRDVLYYLLDVHHKPHCSFVKHTEVCGQVK